MRETERIRKLCETALFIAVVFLGVFIIKFPGPFGYAHIGDSMIFLAVLMLGGRRGALSGGIGAAIADIVSGYTIWAAPTLICKALMALVMGGIIKMQFFGLKGRALWIIAAFAGGIVQGIAYEFFWFVLFSKAAAIAALPGLTFQTVSGVIIAFVISETLQKTALRKNFVYTTDGGKEVSGAERDSAISGTESSSAISGSTVKTDTANGKERKHA